MSASARRVHVDTHLCEGHGLCVDLAPEVFDLGDDDVARCDVRPADTLWNKVDAAVDACPRGAISVVSEQHSSSDRTGRAATA
ncbi:ferredoxin [Mycolicibacterium arseniciresistens]|uniref:Ferredoxin n=1 Tax=Mycolicibacterium arseniciresistens TaxID=3062257 RepID=A0ABT8UDE4_9MYCO|nr:ferredoxin [Mycolicibacterium arseniciresistens]MDO3635811.1 ferredoxin [Mycolicibacterium arseniciresistens]